MQISGQSNTDILPDRKPSGLQRIWFHENRMIFVHYVLLTTDQLSVSLLLSLLLSHLFTSVKKVRKKNRKEKGGKKIHAQHTWKITCSRHVRGNGIRSRNKQWKLPKRNGVIPLSCRCWILSGFLAVLETLWISVAQGGIWCSLLLSVKTQHYDWWRVSSSMGWVWERFF